MVRIENLKREFNNVQMLANHSQTNKTHRALYSCERFAGFESMPSYFIAELL